MAQKTIKSFFKPLQTPEKIIFKKNDADTSINEPSLKKIKSSPNKKNEMECVSEEKSSLTQDQKLKMERNKLKALLIQQCKKTSILHESMGLGWFEALRSEFSKPYFINLNSYVLSERSRYTIYPPPTQVFSWSNYCDIKNVKVVILGQDPYHGIGQAHGLCFSVQKGIPPPPSLINMYKELEKDIPGFKHPGHGYLVGWAKQGVLLLNACLTVRANNANSHKDQGWEKFTDAVIKAVSSQNSNVVFLLWGSYAQKKAAVVDKKHHLLNAPHPSPLSAHRGFFGCKHFSKCNELLLKSGKDPIDWTHLPVE
ncbi:UNVERIFIED_CONTAM: hypothetical protein RMT77_004869 [Armadillidium vulgare]